MTTVLHVRNLRKSFTSGGWPFSQASTFVAVNSISFHLGQGEILGFLGTNGAGKTTTIQMLLGTLTPSSGSIEYFGKDFQKHRIACLKKIGYASGYDKLPGRLTVQENLDVIGRIYQIPDAQRKEQIERLMLFFGITRLAHKQAGTLSAGQTTRMMLAKAFIADPEIVLLDEPTASLDPDIAHEVRQFILTQSQERKTSVLITSHNMDEVTELCDRVLVLKNGSIIADNTPESLAQSISQVRIHLLVVQALDRLAAYLAEAQLRHTIEENQVMIEINEEAIADFLASLGDLKIKYSQISIDKPTLEDYFLSVSKGG